MVAVFPFIVAVVSTVFGAIVFGQWRRRGRPQQAIWALALAMAAVASFAFAGFQLGGSEVLFRTYYIFGGLLMAAYLGMGSLYLVLSRRLADRTLVVLTVVGLLGVVLILQSPLKVDTLHHVQQVGGAGTGVLQDGLWLLPVILLNIFGALAVIGAALFSALRVWRKQAPLRFAMANVTIAVGTGIISEAGSSARLGSPNAFWIVMAIGWVVIFAGFLLTTNLSAIPAISWRDLRLGRSMTA